MSFKNINAINRQKWLKAKLKALPNGAKILDAGAGQLRNKPFCNHLAYLSQDFCQYDGVGDRQGLQTGEWDNSKIDIVSDIVCIPLPDASMDVILCSEVLEHIPDPVKALDEFARILKPGGVLVLTAPFSSLVHFAPYHFCTGFSKYWYEHHLPARRIQISEMVPNGDWYDLCRQELLRLGSVERSRKFWLWPAGYVIALAGWLYFFLRGRTDYHELGCFGWHVLAVKQ